MDYFLSHNTPVKETSIPELLESEQWYFSSFCLSETASSTDSNLFDPAKFPRKRLRKSKQVLQLLEAAFRSKQPLTRDRLENIANQTGLNASQVYKWLWEKKKTRDASPSFLTNETLQFSQISQDLSVIQKRYSLALRHCLIKKISKKN